MAEAIATAQQPAILPSGVGRSRADSFVVFLVLTFAFLAASFPARNSDFWLHLATGRLLADGQYHFGVEPFSYPAEGTYWVNHAWLFDWGLYTTYRSLGDAALVFVKALGVVFLVALMLSLSGRNGPFWLTAGCTLLAVLAMSPRLLLQPACLSLLLLGGTFWLLRRGGRAFYLLPALMAVWVNVDVWFWLGPALVGLYWLGGSTPRLPIWMIPACLCACLASPHHYHAFTLPAELSPAVWGSELQHDVRFAPWFASPWLLNGLGHSAGYPFSAWAYLLLTGLAVVSFAVNRSALQDWRLPVGLAFALLGAWQTRLIPFNAVIVAPIAAMNLSERIPRRAFARLGRVGVGLVTVALLFLTWPGWLQGFQRSDRPLAWRVEADPTLQRVAESLSQLRSQPGLSADQHIFANHPDVAHYCSWFCPGEKVFLDSRLGLSTVTLNDFERLCWGLDPSLHRDYLTRGLPVVDGDALLENYRIGCVVLYDPEMRRLASSIRNVMQSPQKWKLLRVEGQAVVVLRHRAEAGESSSDEFNAKQMAFDGISSPPIGWGPARLTSAPAWWELFARRPSGSSWQADSAKVYLCLFENGIAEQAARQRSRVLARHMGGIIAAAALDSQSLPGFTALSARLTHEDLFLPDGMERPPDLPLLAIRAARHAITEHPDDAGAWLTLAQAYLFLGRTTTEATGYATLSPLTQIRYIQTVTALMQAITLRPDLANAHEMLARLYAEAQYFDLALRHRTIQLDLVRQAGRFADESEDAYAARLERLQVAVESMRTVVQDSENRFLVKSHHLAGDPLGRARIALQLGLAGRALEDVLLRSHADLYGIEGLRLLLELLLYTGRAPEARELLDREELLRNPDALGYYDMPGNRPGFQRWNYRFPAYHWFDFCQRTAAGSYEAGDDALELIRNRLKREGDLARQQLKPRLALRVAGEIGMGSIPEGLLLRDYARREEEQVAGMFAQTDLIMVERADLHVLAGMLAVERGTPLAATDQFRAALLQYRQVVGRVPALSGQPLSQRYLERMRSVLQH